MKSYQRYTQRVSLTNTQEPVTRENSSFFPPSIFQLLFGRHNATQSQIDFAPLSEHCMTLLGRGAEFLVSWRVLDEEEAEFILPTTKSAPEENCSQEKSDVTHHTRQEIQSKKQANTKRPDNGTSHKKLTNAESLSRSPLIRANSWSPNQLATFSLASQTQLSPLRPKDREKKKNSPFCRSAQCLVWCTSDSPPFKKMTNLHWLDPMSPNRSIPDAISSSPEDLVANGSIHLKNLRYLEVRSSIAKSASTKPKTMVRRGSLQMKIDENEPINDSSRQKESKSVSRSVYVPSLDLYFATSDRENAGCDKAELNSEFSQSKNAYWCITIKPPLQACSPTASNNKLVHYKTILSFWSAALHENMHIMDLDP